MFNDPRYGNFSWQYFDGQDESALQAFRHLFLLTPVCGSIISSQRNQLASRILKYAGKYNNSWFGLKAVCPYTTQYDVILH